MASCRPGTAPAESSAASVWGQDPREGSEQIRRRGLKQRKKQKTCRNVSPPPVDPCASRLSYVVELSSDTISGYLGPADVVHLLQACPVGFSPEFIHALVLRAINQFAVDNMTHLGWGCSCDWIRSLGFWRRHDRKCPADQPFGVKKSLSVLQDSCAAQNFLDALLFAQEHLKRPLCSGSKRYDNEFVPLVCPLVTIETNPRHLNSKAAITRAMNSLHQGAGSRFFYKSRSKKSGGKLMFGNLEGHWKGIDASTCGYCESTKARARQREVCQQLYRPLKAAMEKELQYVRFIPKPRCQRKMFGIDFFGRFDGLVAGVTKGGVLCGLYNV